jgi:hypothetical protein
MMCDEVATVFEKNGRQVTSMEIEGLVHPLPTTTVLNGAM